MQKIDIFVKNLILFQKKHLKVFNIHRTIKAGKFGMGDS